MSHLIRQKVGHLKCQAVGHEISEKEEDRLYVSPSREIDSTCNRCGAKVHAKMNQTNEDEYFVDEI
ncbi:MAG: hypothetical protein ABI340_04535 [Nitrososphaera sp.]